MNATLKTLTRILVGYLIFFPIQYLVFSLLNVLSIDGLLTLRWSTLLMVFCWFFIAGLINRKNSPVQLLALYPALSALYLLHMSYFPMLIYAFVFSSLALLLSRKELPKFYKLGFGFLSAILFLFFLFSQPLIVREKGFGRDINYNMIHAKMLWDFRKTSLVDVPEEYFLDEKGQKIKFSNLAFRKTIYLTFWKSNNSDCFSEKLKLDTLKNKLSNYNDVLFVDISLDTNDKKWKEYLQKYKPSGIQLISTNVSRTYANFQIESLPFHSLVNRAGFVKPCLGPTNVDWSLLITNVRFVDSYFANRSKVIN